MKEGPTAPFRGLVGTWGRECPGYLILFYAYQKCFGFIKQRELLGNNLNAALSGGIAGKSNKKWNKRDFGLALESLKSKT